MRFLSLLSLLTLTTAVILEPEVGDRMTVKRSDDVNTASLQTLMENQASLIQTLQAELEANKDKLSTLENSLQTNYQRFDNSLQALQNSLQSLQSKLEEKTKAVAFSARISAGHDSESDGLSLGQHQIVPFDEIITNVGQAYNANTGIFTAPVSGTYAFFLTQMTPNNHIRTVLAITKNGSTLDLVYAEGQTDNFDQGSSQVTTHMTSGDQVWVRQNDGDAVRAYYWTIFTGYLLQAD